MIILDKKIVLLIFVIVFSMSSFVSANTAFYRDTDGYYYASYFKEDTGGYQSSQFPSECSIQGSPVSFQGARVVAAIANCGGTIKGYFYDALRNRWISTPEPGFPDLINYAGASGVNVAAIAIDDGMDRIVYAYDVNRGQIFEYGTGIDPDVVSGPYHAKAGGDVVIIASETPNGAYSHAYTYSTSRGWNDYAYLLPFNGMGSGEQFSILSGGSNVYLFQANNGLLSRSFSGIFNGLDVAPSGAAFQYGNNLYVMKCESGNCASSSLPIIQSLTPETGDTIDCFAMGKNIFTYHDTWGGGAIYTFDLTTNSWVESGVHTPHYGVCEDADAADDVTVILTQDGNVAKAKGYDLYLDRYVNEDIVDGQFTYIGSSTSQKQEIVSGRDSLAFNADVYGSNFPYGYKKGDGSFILTTGGVVGGSWPSCHRTTDSIISRIIFNDYGISNLNIFEESSWARDTSIQYPVYAPCDDYVCCSDLPVWDNDGPSVSISSVGNSNKVNMNEPFYVYVNIWDPDTYDEIASWELHLKCDSSLDCTNGYDEHFYGTGNPGSWIHVTERYPINPSGGYRATLTATDTFGAQGVDEQIFEVIDPATINHPPVANIETIYPSKVFAGEEIYFRGSASDEDGDFLTYEWRIDGGVVDNSISFYYDTTGLTTGGIHTVQFRVNDGEDTTVISDNFEILVIPGETTKWVYSDLGISENLKAVEFINDNVGFVVGDSGVVFKTEDAGGTWLQKGDFENNVDFTGIAFKNINEGWISTSQGEIYETVDGGNTWGVSYPEFINLFEEKYDDFVPYAYPPGWVGHSTHTECIQGCSGDSNCLNVYFVDYSGMCFVGSPSCTIYQCPSMSKTISVDPSKDYILSADARNQAGDWSTNLNITVYAGDLENLDDLSGQTILCQVNFDVFDFDWVTETCSFSPTSSDVTIAFQYRGVALPGRSAAFDIDNIFIKSTSPGTPNYDPTIGFNDIDIFDYGGNEHIRLAHKEGSQSFITSEGGGIWSNTNPSWDTPIGTDLRCLDGDNCKMVDGHDLLTNIYHQWLFQVWDWGWLGQIVPGEEIYSDLDFIDSDHIWLVGQGGHIKSTSDGGLTWGDCQDLDGDGFYAGSMDCGILDCNDDPSNNGAMMYPGNLEVCDGLDNNCDGRVTDDASGETAPLNSNQNGVCLGSNQLCGGTSGWIDDYSGIPYYEEVETSCDGLDNDCDGDVDGSCPLNPWVDLGLSLSGSYYGDVWGSSANNIFVAGRRSSMDRASILRFNGVSWSESTPFGNLYFASRFFGINSNNLYLVGHGGLTDETYRFNGVSWIGLNEPSQWSLYGVWGTSTNNIYFVGRRDWGNPPGILHYNGVSWHEEGPTYLSKRFYDIWGTAANNIYAVGQGGLAYHYDGSSWSSFYVGSQNLNDIWGSSANDIYTVGEGGVVWHYDGSSWTNIATTEVNLNPEYSSCQSIWGSSASDVFLICSKFEDSKIYHFDGSSWVEMTKPVGIECYGVWGSSGDNVYASCNDKILHYSGSASKVLSKDSKIIERDIASLSPPVSKFGKDILNNIKNFFTKDKAPQLSWVSPFVQDLYAVDFIDINNGYVVGDNGVILSTQDGGDNWNIEVQPDDTYASLYDIFALDSDEAYAVGERGLIAHKYPNLPPSDVAISISSGLNEDLSHPITPYYTFINGGNIILEGNAIDSDLITYEWLVTEGTEYLMIGVGSTLNLDPSTLSPGMHTIMLNASDVGGLWNVDMLEIRIKDLVNIPPTSEIQSVISVPIDSHLEDVTLSLAATKVFTTGCSRLDFEGYAEDVFDAGYIKNYNWNIDGVSVSGKSSFSYDVKDISYTPGSPLGVDITLDFSSQDDDNGWSSLDVNWDVGSQPKEGLRILDADDPTNFWNNRYGNDFCETMCCDGDSSSTTSCNRDKNSGLFVGTNTVSDSGKCCGDDIGEYYTQRDGVAKCCDAPDYDVVTSAGCSYSNNNNLLRNPSFEVDSGVDFDPTWEDDDSIGGNLIPDGWGPGWGSSTRVTEIDGGNSYSGNYGMKINDQSKPAYVANDVPVEQGKTYKISGYVKVDSICATENCHGTVGVHCKNSDHVVENDMWGCPPGVAYNWDVIVSPTWSYVEYITTIDRADVGYLSIHCYKMGGDVPGTVWCDDFEVEEVVSTCGDGVCENDETCFNCPQDCSCVGNVLPNPSFEVDSGVDFYPESTRDDNIVDNLIPDGWSTAYDLAVIDSSTYYEGSYSVKVNPGSSSQHGFLSHYIPVQSGRSYKVGGYMKVDSVCAANPNCEANLALFCINKNTGGSIYNCPIDIDDSPSVNSQAWTYVETEFMVDNPDIGFIEIACHNSVHSASVDNGDIWCDSFSFEETNVVECNNNGICDAGERCSDCYGDCQTEQANCANGEVCLYSDFNGFGPQCVVSCSSEFACGCFERECPRDGPAYAWDGIVFTYEDITGHAPNYNDPLSWACAELDPNQEPHYETWLSCKYDVIEKVLEEPPEVKEETNGGDDVLGAPISSEEIIPEDNETEINESEDPGEEEEKPIVIPDKFEKEIMVEEALPELSPKGILNRILSEFYNLFKYQIS